MVGDAWMSLLGLDGGGAKAEEKGVPVNQHCCYRYFATLDEPSSGTCTLVDLRPEKATDL